jgi:threonine dehydrogenase-like Zn-dependent dehydrogenase
MKAIAIDRAGELGLVDVPDPEPDERSVLVRTRRVGICATDREMVRSKTIYQIPEGEDHLILGHEGLGVIDSVPPGTTGLEAGDVVVPSAYIQWPPMDPSLARCRVDLCPYGKEFRRGINSHGFFREAFAERPEYLLKVPPDLTEVAVLLEPLTVTLKGFTDAQLLRDRWLGMPCGARPGDYRQRVMVIGAGPIGMLGIMLARTYGWETVGVDAVPEDSLKAQLIRDVGAHYVDARATSAADIGEQFGTFDVIVECVQEPTVLQTYLDLLGIGSVFVLVGWTAADKEVSLNIAELVRTLLDKQATILSTTGAGHAHYVEGMRRLSAIKASFGDVLERSVTTSLPYADFAEGFAVGGPDQVKTVLEF